MATITHLSGLAGYVIPLGGVLVPIVLWVANKRSPVIVAVAKQALLLNLLVLLSVPVLGLFLIVVLAATGGFSSNMPVGSILIAVGLIGALLALTSAAVLLPLLGAAKASKGEYYRYPVVGTSPR